VEQDYNQYLTSKVLTASKAELIVIQYEAAITFMKKAREQLLAKEIAAHSIGKASAILFNLVSSLDMNRGKPIAANLMNLYRYMIDQLLLAGRTKNPQYLEAPIYFMSDLKTAWDFVVKQTSSSETSGSYKKVV